ncbi:MAG: ABC transporter permease [Oscillospiraceae bacterium]|nr:ABC transporter permease [Oscillospiraceae bacterium]MDY3219790.1 ABC transporter permease [Candidatus Fimivivens sp.]SFJ27493.1 peptide/nickel transport system permease protein [Ruminococcaceae bacterium D5]
MYRYVIKRLLLMIPVVLGVSFIIFTIMYFIPGDPASNILGVGASPEAVAQLNEELGYNDPFIVRYVNYISDAVLHLDLGTSYQNKLPVTGEIAKRLPVSATLAFGSIMLSLLIGVPIGVLSAVKQYSLWDKIPTGLALLVAAMPAFIIGMLLMLVFSLQLGILPVSGVTQGLKSYILPVISLGLPYGARQLRFTRSSMLETIRQDYVRTAKAKGASQKKTIWGHAMKNALMPVITVAGTSFGALLGGAIATESLFGLPGLGTYISDGIKLKDVPAVLGGIIVFALLFSLVMLAVDLSYAFVDPRIKARYAGRR